VAAQHRQLVPQHDNLRFLELSRSEQQQEQLQHAVKRDVQDREGHGASEESRTAGLFYADRVSAPHRVLTTDQAAQLLDVLSPLGRTMAGLALLSGLRRGELFALRWQDVDEHERMLGIREAVYEGRFIHRKPRPAFGRFRFPTER